MASGLFGLGTGTPSRFPYPDRPQSGPGLGAGQGQNVRARFVIIFGNTGGLFVYSGTPAFGNLITTITATSGTDPYGNAYLGGITEYASIGVSGYEAMQHTATGLIAYVSPGGAGGPYGVVASFQQSGGVFTLAAPLIVTGAVTAIGGTAANPTVITTDTWQTLAPINGWANVTTLKYTLLPDRMVMVAGVITSAGAAGNPIFANLPAGYRPATQQETAAGLHGAPPAGGAFMRVAVNGDLSIPGSTVGTGPWSVSWTFSLDYA